MLPFNRAANQFRTWLLAALLLGFSAIVSAGIPTLITAELPVATTGLPYTANLFIGGVPAPTTVVITGLPAGLVYAHNGSGSVAISGTPPGVTGGLLINVLATNSVGTLNAGLTLRVLPAPADVNNATAIASGASYHCALVNGGVQCWGYGGYGIFGFSNNQSNVLPVQIIPSGSGVTAISARSGHVCGLVKGGVQCWGANEQGQLGDGSTSRQYSPTRTIGLESGVTAVSAGSNHTCALRAGSVFCWGNNHEGQLGDGTTVNRSLPTLISSFGNNVIAVTAGADHTCAVVGGGVKCVGANYNGQLGDGSYNGRTSPIQTIAAGSGASGISGASHTCAIVNAGLRCWGANNFGQIGDGGTSTRPGPVEAVAAGSGVTQVETSGDNTCVVINGGIKCWGSNAYGQLGDGKTLPSRLPVQTLASGSGASQVAAGPESICMLANGSVTCVGSLIWGQRGDGSGKASPYPLQVLRSGSAATAVSSGNSATCAIVAEGVQCWGNNYYGTVGDGTTTARISPVQTIAPNSGVTSIATANYNTCAIANGGVLCWGTDYQGNIGDGTATDRFTPTQIIATNSGVTSVAVGAGHGCAVVSGGLFCWGNNENGQVGDGSTANRPSPVQIIPIFSGVTAASAGRQHSCAVITAGVKCWGANESGQLGDGTKTSRRSPVQVIASDSAVTTIAAGNDTTCATVAGGVRCWGFNGTGQLGDGSFTTQLSPVQVIPNGSTVAEVTTSNFHSCARQDGGVRCWGTGLQVGDGYSILATNAVPSVAANSGVTSVSAGLLHTCATVNGGIVCWGRNDYLQLGDASVVLGKKVSPHLILAILPQAITISTAAPPSVVLGATPISLSATGGDSGNAVVFATTSAASVCTVTANQVRFVGAGTCSITANQAGDINYYAAPTVTINIVITQIVQVIGFVSPPTTVIFGVAPFTLVTSGGGSGNLIVLATTSAASVCSVTGNQVQFVGGGACNIVANQVGNTNYSAAATATITIVITKAAQSVSFASLLPASVAVGAVPITLSATGGASGSPVVFATTSTATVCTVTNSQLRFIGLGSCVVTADQAGNNNYNAASQITASIAVGQGLQTITFNPVPPVTVAVGGALIALTANGGASGNPVSFSTSSVPTICTITGTLVRTVGVGSCNIAANQSGSVNYSAAAPTSASIIITQGTQTISSAGGGPIAAGTGLTLALTGGQSGNPVTITSSTPTICTVQAPKVIGVSAGNCMVLLNQAGNANYAAAPQVTQNITILGIEAAATNRYRIFIPSTGGHLYTTDKNEYDSLKRFPSTYVDEGVDHKIFTSALLLGTRVTTPYYRLFIRGIRQHFWTTDLNEYNVLRAQTADFSDEGIDGYLFLNAGIAGTVPLYRLVLNGTAIHHWTIDKNEFDFLVNSGSWVPEGALGNPSGVTGYVLPK